MSSGLIYTQCRLVESGIYLRGMLETLSLIHCVKLLHPVSKYARQQQVSAYNRSFLTIFRIHGFKEILFCLLHDKKITLAVLLYAFIIGFPAFNT